jgi:selenocysteine-specific elongation factor
MSKNSPRHIIIGTAGHVDHGKTTLIRALTGIDTDRLREEKERGMTIDLGFASLRLPGGATAGIVDVPGHERFLKNMLAGATGVDVVLLVIAADEGVMPQTVEHLEILELLEAHAGVVALTKSDMVEPEWLTLVADDVRRALSGTFLAGAKVLPMSGVTGEGVEELKVELARLVGEAEAKSAAGPFRLPVDRVFTMTGFGTVVTGTLVSGTIRVGDPVRVLPDGIETRVRGLQVHGAKQSEAAAGSRVAANLVGVETDDLMRGSVLVPPGYLAPSPRIDALLRVLPGASRPIKNRNRVRLHIGTSEHIGRVSVIGAVMIEPGAEGYVQFVSETPVVAARGDRFVVRSYSPVRTVAGGVVLDPVATRHRAKDMGVVATLEARRRGELPDMLEDALLRSPGPVTLRDLAAAMGATEDEVRTAAERVAPVQLEGGRLIHRAIFEQVSSRIEDALQSYHASHPLKSGMPKEELRATAVRSVDTKGFAAILAELEHLARVETTGSTVKLANWVPKLSSEQNRASEEIEQAFKAAGMNPPGPEGFNEAVFHYLVDSGTIIKLDEGLFMHHEAVQRAESILRESLSPGKGITVSAFRDLTGSSRKFVVPLLEYFDTKRVTRRVGDERVLFSRQP